MTDQQSQALAPANHTRPRALSFEEKLQYAKTLADSGLLPQQYRKQPANLLYAIEYGEMLGLPAMAAINGVHVIEGKPSASAALISALVRRAGHRLRLTGDGQRALCEIVRHDDPEFTFRSEWTMERARASGLGNKPTWKNYPAAMLKARALTECARDACQEALSGLQYTPEELGAETNEEGVPIRDMAPAAAQVAGNIGPRTAEVMDDGSKGGTGAAAPPAASGARSPGAQRQADRLASKARAAAAPATTTTETSQPSVQPEAAQEAREGLSKAEQRTVLDAEIAEVAKTDPGEAQYLRTGSGHISADDLATYIDPANAEGLDLHWKDELLPSWDSWKGEKMAEKGPLNQWTAEQFVQGAEGGGRHTIGTDVLAKVEAKYGPETATSGALRLDYCMAVMRRRYDSLRLHPQAAAALQAQETV